MDLDDAAFGGTPGAAPLLRRGAPPRERWLAAVVLGGQGRYAAAAALLDPLLADPCVPQVVAAHAAVTLGAHRRQLGGHAAARRLDALGLRLATAAGDGAAAARVDALVGLAADALGTGDLGGAHRLLAATVDAVAPAAVGSASWRPAVRAGWVRAELALFGGRPRDAVAPAAAALAAAERAGAVRHVLKSRIVLAVARAAADPAGAPAAMAELDAVRGDAAAHGLLPLCWPAALAAADLDDGAGARRRRHAALTTVSVLMDYADPVGRRLMGESVWVPRVAVGSLVAPFGPSSPT